jgi:hypothetical protein
MVIHFVLVYRLLHVTSSFSVPVLRMRQQVFENYIAH